MDERNDESDGVSERLASFTRSDLPDEGSEVAREMAALCVKRLRDLQPFIEEEQRLRQILALLAFEDRGGDQSWDELRATVPRLISTPDLPNGRSDGIRKPLKQRKDEIIRLVADTPGVRPSELARAQGLTTSRVSQILNDMVQEGTVVRTGKGLRLVHQHDVS